MESSGGLFNPGFLGSSFLWWVGQIADDSTWRDNINPGNYEDKNSIPGWGRRYKVRIIGLHDQGEVEIPSDQLPWANVMYPITAGGFQTNSGATPQLRQGNMVFGFFLDGQDQQVPVIMGVLGNNSQTELSQTIGDSSVTNAQAGSIAKSGYATGATDKGNSKEITPDQDKVIKQPARKSSSSSSSTPQLNQFGLDPTKTLTSEQLKVATEAREAARAEGKSAEEVEVAAQQAVAATLDSTVAREDAAVEAALAKSEEAGPGAKPQPGATLENESVHQITAGDVKRSNKCDEKIVLMKPDDVVQSALKGIQTVIENLTAKIDQYLQAIQSYVDAVSSTINSLQKLISDAACEMARYMKIIFDKIMEYVMKIFNKGMNAVVAALPSSLRYQFGDMKEVLTELIQCLYNKLMEGMCDIIAGALTDSINPDQLEKDANDRASNGVDDKGNTNASPTNPRVPICYSEDIVSSVLSGKRDEIDSANNNLLDNMNAYMEDISGVLAGVSGALSDVNNLIPDISGGISAALNFTNLKFEVFGCDLTPNLAASDFYTFCNGGDGTAPTSLPSEPSVAKGVETAASTAPNQSVPFAEPTKDTGTVNNQNTDSVGIDAALAASKNNEAVNEGDLDII